MEDITKDIINRAIQHQQEGMSDFELACLVHIELGKILYYDNNYTSKLKGDDKKDETELSQNRKERLLSADTDKSSKEQICKGMAEIYAEILNELGIEAEVKGPIIKGKIEKENQEKAEHYCVLFKIGNQEYVQDYLIEATLARIKMGEAEVQPSKKMPGICKINEYEQRNEIKLRDIELAQEYINNTFGDISEDLDINSIVALVFEELNRNFRENEYEWGFEEVKDFVIPALMGVLKKDELREKVKDIKTCNITNLVKETETKCGVACVYEINGRKYLVRGQDGISDIDIPAGEISDEDLVQILNQGYEGRSKAERDKCEKLKDEYMQEYDSTLSPDIASDTDVVRASNEFESELRRDWEERQNDGNKEWRDD